MDRQNYGEALRRELIELVQEHLTPAALRYEYSSAALDSQIKWRPIVLILGNYSSGKSTLINELIGADVQATGQAPTDDSFTVITRTEDLAAQSNPSVAVKDEREGYVLLNDPVFPFESLKRHGQRFASHFRLKRVNSSFLADLAIIDTPGMLDSIAERDRGYNYQEVVGDLAQIADLILILFDPHKAGTVRESYESIRKTLPESTLEDRLVFVLNRVDECENLNDLIRVYGTLCWNLSQMLGRKDIPKILLTYAPEQKDSANAATGNFLHLLRNERDHLRHMIQDAPRHRLDHLANYIEMHGARLSHFLEAVVAFAKQQRRFRVRFWIKAIVTSLFAAGLSAGALWLSQLEHFQAPTPLLIFASVVGILFLGVSLGPWQRQALNRYRDSLISRADSLTPLGTQERKDNWEKIKKPVVKFLSERFEQIPLAQIKSDLREVSKAYQSASKSAREALNEYYKL
jgi:EH domain-containing protein 1